MSADGLEQPFPAFGSPVQAYQAYFSGAEGGSIVPPSERLARDQSLLDHVRGDARKLEGELRGRELEKIQQLQESHFQLEGQLQALYETQALCENPVSPPESVDIDNANLSPETVAAHGEVLFNTLLCGLTHVAHFSALGREAPHHRYGWVGDTKGHHESHHQNDLPALLAIDTYMLSQLAELRARLEQVPEGNGTMADHTLIVYINCCGGKHHGGQDSHPVVILGNAGGQLETGRYLSYAQNEHSLGDV